MDETNSFFLYILVLWLKCINYWTYTDVIWATKCLSKGAGIVMFYNHGRSHVEFIFASVCILLRVIWEMDCEESWALKNWWFWTVVLEKTLENPLDCKEIQPVHSKGGQSWVFFGSNDAKAETPVLWPPHASGWLIGKDSDARRDWGQEEKGMTEDEMAGWHRWLNGHEFEWTPGVGEGQVGLACCDSWGRKESDTTERLNWTELN